LFQKSWDIGLRIQWLNIEMKIVSVLIVLIPVNIASRGETTNGTLFLPFADVPNFDLVSVS
jgi:hypothetical protein